MDIRIAAHSGYLSIRVDGREGAADSGEAVRQILHALETADTPRALLVVQRAPAGFRIEGYQLSDALLRAAGIPGTRIALVSDDAGPVASFEYVERLARQKDLAARAFRAESEALRWLLA